MTDLSQTPLNDLSVETGTRPKAPKLKGATDEHRRQGRKLAAIHRGHLWDLARIAKVLDRIEAGDAPSAELQKIVLSLDMSENFRAFGSLCGRECKMLAFHHDIEQASMFPQLEAGGNDGITKLVGRLREEHFVVHELIKRLERASMTLMFESGEAEFAEARDIFRKLKEVVASHFHYEESELEEALGMFVDAF